jgi:hypothetical protein
MTSHLDKLGRKLAEVEVGLKKLSRSNNLGHSSFDGGAIQQNEGDGSPGSVFGTQFDGTNGLVPLSGPIPPTPAWVDADTDVRGVVGGIDVRWQGAWENDAIVPLDFTSIEIHVSDTPNFSALLFDTMKTSITSPRGGEVLIPLTPGFYYVRLVARTSSGRMSVASAPAGPVEARAVTREDLGFDITELAGNRVFRGAIQPTSTVDAPLLFGDLWLKTPENTAYRFEPPDPGTWNIVQDQAIVQAINDAADAAGLATAAGLTASDAQALAGAASTLAATKNTTFYQASMPSTGAASVGDQWVDTDDGNKTYTWNGTIWAPTLLGAQAIAATARQLGAVTIYRQSSAPASGMITGDYWIDSDDNQPYYYSGTLWVVSRDLAVNTALTNAATAQATADGKAVIYYQTSAPTGKTSADVGDEWVDIDDNFVTYTWSGTAWVKNAISTSSFKPNSLVVSSVAATGSITAALLESILVLTTTIVAGDPNHTHTKIRNDGVYVFSDDPTGGAPTEVIRMGTQSNDFFGITSSAGLLILTLDMTGAVNARTANFREDINIQGRPLLTGILADIPGGGVSGSGAQNIVGFTGASTIDNVVSEVGLFEIQRAILPGRMYRISPSVYWTASDTSTYLVLTVRDGGTAAPTVASPVVTQDFFGHAGVPGWTLCAERNRPFVFSSGGSRRLLLTAAAGGTGSVNIVTVGTQAPTLLVEDLGPDHGNAATVNRGGGGGTPPPPPAQRYDTGWMGPAGWRTYTGSGGQRSDTTDVVQGWDPSGFNGDGSGLWWWNLPSITGTVNEVWVWLQSNLTYYNSGGTGIVAPIKNPGTYPLSGSQLSAPIQYGTFPKPGSLQMNLSGWAGFFHNNQGVNRAIGISVGPGGGTNEQYYIRFDGPAARMRIVYTQ